MKLKLLFRNICGNKKKALICIVGVTLSVMLLFVSINSYISFQNMRLENAYESYGEYNIILHNVDEEIYEWAKTTLSEDAQIGIEKIYGITADGVNIISSDPNATSMNRYKIVSGHLPENEKEMAISATAIINDAYVINQYNIGDAISLEGKKYTLSGIIDDYDYSTNITYKVAVVGDVNEACTYNIYFHCKDKESYLNDLNTIKSYLEYDEKDLIYCDKGNGFVNNGELIDNIDLNNIEMYGEGSLEDKNIGRLLIAIIIVLVLTSVILGIHLFCSYLNGRNKQLGILKSLGFSDSYICFLYFVECIFLVSIGCVLGIVLGHRVTYALFDYIQNLRTVKLSNFEPYFTTNSYILIVVISFVSFISGLLPILVRNIRYGINDNVKSIHKKYKLAKSNKNTKRITLKYFLKDNIIFEKISIYASMIIIGFGLMLLLNVKKYTENEINKKTQNDVQFKLMSDDISAMDGFENFIPEATYFDKIYDTTGEFDFDISIINNEYIDCVGFSDRNLIYCDITGISKQQYERKIELSEEMSYEAFVESGGAIIIDNVGEEDSTILMELPDSVSYAERKGDGGPEFEAGKVNIIARSKYKNWKYQRGISIVLPTELFLEKFDYTNVLFRINVEKGHEITSAEKLNKYAYVYNYSFEDNTSEYIKEQDNNVTIKNCTFGVFVFVTVLNFIILVYTNLLVFERRKNNIMVLKLLGHTDNSLMKPMLLEMVVECIVSSIVSVFVSTVAAKALLPQETQDIIFENSWENIVYVVLFLIITKIISVIAVFIKLRKIEIKE